MTSQMNEGSTSRYTRVPHGGPVAFKASHQQNATGVVKNLSETGMLLSTKADYTCGTELLIYLPLRNKGKETLCILSGKIVRQAIEGQGYNLKSYGLSFASDLSSSSKRMLENFVRSKRGESPLPSSGKGRFSPFRD